MKELFNEDGHITDFGFNSLIDKKLDKINRLEIAEHTSFCDECLLRYMDLFDDSILISAPEAMQSNIMKKITYKTRRFYLNQYISMAIAACFAMIFWMTGVFTVPVFADYNSLDIRSSIMQKTDNFSDSIDKLFNIINLKGVLPNEKE